MNINHKNYSKVYHDSFLLLHTLSTLYLDKLIQSFYKLASGCLYLDVASHVQRVSVLVDTKLDTNIGLVLISWSLENVHWILVCHSGEK